ncbi:MAG: recombinase family protein [Christensenellaceae bacterium]|jgi:DNA invertase Pin-like site-specific DNA recombinase|nr:recombinase family protein [Christensenellaceae bacterium]
MATNKINAVIYARYSSHGQTEQSIEGQLRDCYALAERDGYQIVGEYIDRALTGRYDGRPDFQRMIADAAKKQFQIVIVWKFDRFARNRFDSATYKARLKKYGVKVISVTEPITDSPEGIILEGLLESMAEYYSANLSKHVKRGQRESIIKGTYLGAIPPMGFKVVDKKLVADERTAPTIRFVFEQYAAGVPKKKIIDELNAKGIRSYFGKPLSFSSFQDALRNEKYIGRYIFNGQEVAGGCEALIDEETFRRVQARLDAVRRAPAASKAREIYFLQGKAYCGMCGARLVGDSGTSRTGDTHHYYSCGARKKFHSCQKKSEKKAFLEWYVVEQTVEYVLVPERMDYIARCVVEEYENEFSDKQLRSLERRISSLDREISTAVDELLATPSKIVKRRIEEKAEALDAQKADLEADLARLRIANGIRYSKEQILAWMKLFCAGDALDPEFQQHIINTFVNSVYVYDDKIVIYYNMKDGKQISFIEMLDSSEEPKDEAEGNSASVRISKTKA